jgi:hypothetical protein
MSPKKKSRGVRTVRIPMPRVAVQRFGEMLSPWPGAFSESEIDFVRDLQVALVEYLRSEDYPPRAKG